MSARLTLMAVHAHPDDESIGTGGVLTRYVEEGHRSVLVTCTGGEVGEIAPGSNATPVNLAEVRQQELERAVEILGISALYLLGYRDSGMLGTPDNEHPSSFHQAPLEEATAKLVSLIRCERPHVLVTYDENGFYGHPDHVKAHRITVAAFEAAGDPSRFPDEGEPWEPLKLYYTAVPKSAMVTFGQKLREHGVTPPSDLPEGEDPPFGTPDELVTTVVDVAPQIERKRRALLAHATQMGPEVFFSRLPPALFDELFSRESFQLVKSRRPLSDREDDLFAGLR